MDVSVRYGCFLSPMRFRFKHASADRNDAQNIIVCITNKEGVAGFGEGCPRSYVTGETTQSAINFLAKYTEEIATASKDLSGLKSWVEANEELIDENPAAFCAIEMALLDYIARRDQLSVEALLKLSKLDQTISYTAVVGDSSIAKTYLTSMAYMLYGFSDFKVKLSGNIQHDKKRLALLPQRTNIRFDANNLWQRGESCIDFCQNLERKFWAIEEPVKPFDFDSMNLIANTLHTKIILDESLYLKQHLHHLPGTPEKFIANIRISKCGGILRSIELAKQSQERGLGLILGAHVGETSLLTRAALVVGQSCNKAPIAREGAYGSLLLKKDISEPSLRFRRRGEFKPSTYKFPENSGLALSIDPLSINWFN